MDFEKLHGEESGRILATLIRLLGDFDLAEEALQEAYAVALQKWPSEGTPANPRAWLISTARHKAIDRLRRDQRFAQNAEEIANTAEIARQPESDLDEEMFADDRLRLIFTCCHPSLSLEARVALTLRTVCGITTEEISRAFLVPVATMAQRLVRAKGKIREAGIPYRVPVQEELRDRLDGVLLVVYLIFNEGYLASSGDALIRRAVCAEAIRLGRVLCGLLPKEAEAQALLGLMLLHDSRRDARVSTEDELVLLEEQDRDLWHWEQIREGTELTESALRRGAAGVYALQAAIAALHANAKTAKETDWSQIAGLYDALLRTHASPVVEVNRAVAVAMARSAAEGLALLEEIKKREELEEFHLLPAARADLLRRLGRMNEAAEAYRRALTLATNDIERRFLWRRLAEIEKLSDPGP
ncbi:MAG TPA: RNA polymerase sigma factor [Candidatus Udaeobacter sp.]|nr:RNA polymerase sigma factor [Candidatus Udaeobacter sp.]